MCVSTDNFIGDKGAKVLSQCLTHLTKLSHLDLGCEWALMCYLVCDVTLMMCMSTDNDIGDDGINALSQCLTHLTQLTHLDLSSEYS